MTTTNAAALHTPLDTNKAEWVPLSKGFSFKPLRYFAGLTGYQALLRLEPGTVIPRHRHTGEIHAYNLSGKRLLLDINEVVGPGTYVYEEPGNVDSWMAVGDEPCVIYVEFNGAVEYLADDGTVLRTVDARSNQRAYLDWCASTGRPVDPRLVPASDGEASRG